MPVFMGEMILQRCLLNINIYREIRIHYDKYSFKLQVSSNPSLHTLPLQGSTPNAHSPYTPAHPPNFRIFAA